MISGINTTHPDFFGRASWGFDAVDGANSQRIDDTGHGTAVAGIIITSYYKKEFYIVSIL